MRCRQFIQARRLWICLALLGMTLGLTGCGTDEPENTSSKPWNSPEGYQNGGLPGMMQSH